MKRIGFMLFVMLSSIAAHALSGYVGDYVDLKVTASASDIYSIDWRLWSGETNKVTLTQNMGNNAIVHIDSYFTGNVRVRAQYKTMSNAIKTEYFDITCNAVTITPNPTTLSLKVGETEYIQYTSSPYGKFPSVEYSSNNTSIATVDFSSGRVKAIAKGSTTIKLSNSMGPEASVKVVVDGGDDDSGGSGGDSGGGSGGDSGGGTLKNGDWFQDYTEEGYLMLFVAYTNAYTGVLCAQVCPSLQGISCITYANGKVTIPSYAKGLKVTHVNNNAFHDLPEMTELVIPSTISYVDDYICKKCDKLEKVTCLATDPPTYTNSLPIFESSTTNGTLYVPTGCVSKYQTAKGWKSFKYIKEIGEDSGSGNTIDPTSITISPTSKTIKVDESFTLTYTLTPSNATTTLTWTSDDTSIATVSSSGLVKGIKAGTTKIHVKTANGKTDYCNVTVEASSAVEPTSISLPYSKTVKVGETFTMTYTLTPSNATTTLTWTSDDTSIATVSSTGLVKGIKAGTTKIRAKTANGKTDYCNVTVEESNTGNGDGTLANPFNAIGASQKAGELSVGETSTQSYYVKGEISSIKYSYSAQYGTATFYISDDGTTNNQFYVYCSYYLENKPWVDGNPQIAIGDNVIVYGKLANYNGTLEMANKENYVYSHNGQTDTNNGSFPTQDLSIIAAGDWHSLFVTPDGEMWSCGSNNGKLGNGEDTDCTIPVKVMDKVRSVSAGGQHSLIVKNDGTLWTCGKNYNGELGDGTTTPRFTPVKIMDNVALASGGYNFSLIVKNDGSLWACGMNYNGQLGDGTTTSHSTPVKIMDDVASVSAGADFSLILKKNGTLWVCGDNFFGQLGDGTRTTQKIPIKIMESVSSISAGYNHSLVVKTDGTLWGFGCNRGMCLLENNSYKPIKIMDNVSSASAGDGLSLAIKKDGSLWSWGYNWMEYSGDASTISSPIKIMDNVKRVASYNQVLIMKSDGSIWAGGQNVYGQLGDGTTENKSYFVRVKIPIKISLSSSGYATFYDSQTSYTLPSGLSAQVVIGVVNNKLAYNTIARANLSDILPKGTAVMLVGDEKNAATYSLFPSEGSTSYNGINYLQGSDNATTTTGNGYHYKLSYGQPGTSMSNVFGWYWGAQNGGAFQIDGHKAWLVVPNASAARGFTADGDATGIISVETDEDDALLYDMLGRRLNKPNGKGVFIKNGKKVVVK